MNELCSVVCVTYNHAEFSAVGLQSIFDQSYRNIEIIVLDDGSSDKNAAVVRETLKNSPFPHKFIEQENSGNVSENFNIALSHVTGTFVTFLSLDDVLCPDTVKNGVQKLSENPNYIFAANTGYQEIDDKNDVILANGKMPVAKFDISSAQDLLEAEYELIGTFYIQGQIFRASAVQAVGGFDAEKTGDDIILRTKLFRHLIDNPNLGFWLGTDVVINYRKHASNLHKQSFRQIRTVIEWKESFFPDREYPQMFFDWLENFLRECARHNMQQMLNDALAYHPVIAEHYAEYRKSAKMRSIALRTAVKGLFKR